MSSGYLNKLDLWTVLSSLIPSHVPAERNGTFHSLWALCAPAMTRKPGCSVISMYDSWSPAVCLGVGCEVSLENTFLHQIFWPRRRQLCKERQAVSLFSNARGRFASTLDMETASLEVFLLLQWYKIDMTKQRDFSSFPAAGVERSQENHMRLPLLSLKILFSSGV